MRRVGSGPLVPSARPPAWPGARFRVTKGPPYRGLVVLSGCAAHVLEWASGA